MYNRETRERGGGGKKSPGDDSQEGGGNKRGEREGWQIFADWKKTYRLHFSQAFGTLEEKKRKNQLYMTALGIGG